MENIQIFFPLFSRSSTQQTIFSQILFDHVSNDWLGSQFLRCEFYHSFEDLDFVVERIT